MSAKNVTLKVENLNKNYGSVVALSGVSFEILKGEVVALVGDNGAGKSTLVKCVAGSVFPSSGNIYLDGEKVDFHTPGQARDAGIETVYQQLALVDTFDISENLFLGKEVARKGISRLFGILDRKEMRRQALQAIQEFNAKFPDVNAKVETMSGGQRQIVAMTRGAFWGKSLLLLDEPTAALGVQESKSVLEVIERFRSQKQMSLLIISHNLEHVWQVCDRILVLRGGNLVANLIKNDVTKSDVVSHITGAYSK